jgi:hypothetical protein
MTYDELLNNYEYKITKKGMMREYPFIIDVLDTNEEDFTKYESVVFVTLVIDPFILANMFGVKVWGGVTRALKRGDDFDSPTLSIFLENSIDLGIKIRKSIDDFTDTIDSSRALPDEYRMGRIVRAGNYIAYPSSLPPDFMSEPN